MLKNILFHALVGGLIFVTGVILHDLYYIEGPGDFLAYGGMVYAGVTFILIVFGANIPSPFNKSSSFLKKISGEREKKKAREELLEYKKLLDEGVLTQQEFDTKANELKKIIL